MTVPRIGVTLGDPGGVGPEVVLKVLVRDGPPAPASYVLFGDPRILADEARALGLAPRIGPWRRGDDRHPGLSLAEVPAPPGAGRRPGPDAANGAASFRSFEAALAAVREGAVDALVTAPVSKAAWNLAGVPWRGHTEYLEHLHPGAVMSFWSDRLRVALLSHHVPLKEALGRVRKEALVAYFRALNRGVQGLADGPREFLVPGLNPHAGEDGLLGGEEEGEIRPAVVAAREEGIDVRGPFPPDTVFRQALGRRERMVAALYHDQGLIAFKLESFEAGVNVTLGLPFVRTSPDHGTAFDIAGRGLADPRSMAEAVRLAARLTASAS
ncbi:MAG TPA: 4-hydroxythreonine-4-phosphate dehydrogenase PdxA [Terriglobales bacterium]|nr:4-hydroxythreonine-4-phosphate dehydrogenase PdxA [Terriglobales bacterium]